MSVTSKTNNGTFVTMKPCNSALHPYIAYYYFHTKLEGEPVRYIFYPHTRSGLTIYKNSSSVVQNKKATTTPNPQQAYQFMYSGIIDYATQVEILPPFRKIGVAFQPLGINHFIKEPLGVLLDRETHDFSYLEDSMNETLDIVYDTDQLDERVRHLDAYFAARLSPFPEDRLAAAVTIIIEANNKISVQDLSKELSMSRKTLLRLFQKHLNCTVKEYIHVVQFRKALASYQSAVNKPQLGQVAHMTNYYDQSDLIRHFRKITGFNPKKFFSSIELIGTEDTFWTFSGSSE